MKRMNNYEPVEDNADISSLPALFVIRTLAKFLKVIDSSAGTLAVIANLSSVINIEQNIQTLYF